MKKLIFLLPVLALATVFSFCTKENPLPDAVNTPGIEKPVTSRGGTVTVTSTSTTQLIRACNMTVNTNVCVDCLPSGISQSSEVGLTISHFLQSGTRFSVTNISNAPLNVGIFGPNNFIVITLQPGACEVHQLDNTDMII